MAGDTLMTLVGNLTADPELRFTPAGSAVANFTVASTPRIFDRQSNQWRDGDALFMRCSIWRDAAENIAESLHRGVRVIVTGTIVSRTWETREGEKRTSVELQVDEIGPSLRFATATVNRAIRGSAAVTATAAADPWNTTPTAAVGEFAGVGAGQKDNEAPF